MRQITLGNNAIQLHCHYEDREIAKTVPGHKWNKADRAWEYPIRPETYTKLVEMFPGVRVDRQVIAAVTQVAEREAAVAQAKVQGWEGVEPVEPMPLTSKPFAHQILGHNLGLSLPNVAFFQDMGTGKTITSISVAGRRYLRGEIKRLLVVAPNSVVPNWEVEFGLHAAFPYEVKILDGAITKRCEILEGWKENPSVLQVAVVNYEGVRMMIPRDKRGWRVDQSPFAIWVPDMIICDEAQKLKEPGSLQSKALDKLGPLAKYRLALSGTPVANTPLNLFGIYRFLDKSIFGGSYSSFRSRYAVMGGFGGHQVLGHKNLDELILKAHSIAYRVRKEECLDLPETMEEVRYCELESKAAGIYRQMAKESVAEISEERRITATNVLSRLLRLSQVTGGYIDNVQVSSSKMVLLEEVIEDVLEEGSKPVIFARFLSELSAIRTLLEKKEIPYVWIAGEVPQAERQEAVQKFQNDPECKVFLSQLQVGGLGLTLTASNVMIFYSLDYSYANFDQAKCRINRIGQKRNCLYLYLVAKGTIDEKVLKVLQAKKSMAEAIVDDWRSYFDTRKGS